MKFKQNENLVKLNLNGRLYVLKLYIERLHRVGEHISFITAYIFFLSGFFQDIEKLYQGQVKRKNYLCQYKAEWEYEKNRGRKVQKQSSRGVIKKEALAEVFSCDYCEIFRNIFFYRTPPVAASESNPHLFYFIPCRKV